jgi:hypothetical protein
MLEVTRRELKVMLDHRMFSDPTTALAELRSDLGACAAKANASLKGHFDETETREIVFLDTPDGTVLANGFVLRVRRPSGKPEYTLKCRSPDRYIAAAADMSVGPDLEPDEKFEEDIAAPYVSRFSRSITVKGPDTAPATLSAAAALFPALAGLTRDGRACPGDVALSPVGAVSPFERVHKGPVFDIAGEKGEAALILWSNGSGGRLVAAELSFRYKDKHEGFSGAVARAGKRLFEEIQRVDWCAPDSRTKTQLAYGAR